MRPLLVGEVNPYGSDPEMALYPLPEGASGDRLRRILGMTRREYLDAFDRVNLCYGKWSMVAAKEMAAKITSEGRTRILLGRRVAAAFGMRTIAPFTAFYLDEGGFLLLPHPSGRCRAWIDSECINRARRLVREALR